MILVVGSQGFIGSRLLMTLKNKGHEVFGSSRNGTVTNAVQGISYLNFSEIQGLKELPEFEIIINAAGNYSNSRSLDQLNANIGANSGLLVDIARLITPRTQKVLQLGSYLEFAPNPPGIPWSQYAASKLLGRVTLQDYCRDLPTDFISCILYDNYCEDLSRGKFVDQVINSIRNGSTLTLQNTKHQMDLIYVDDLIESLISVSLSLDPDNETIYQIRTRDVYTTESIISMAQELSGGRLKTKYLSDEARGLVVKSVWESAKDWKEMNISFNLETFLRKMLGS